MPAGMRLVGGVRNAGIRDGHLLELEEPAVYLWGENDRHAKSRATSQGRKIMRARLLSCLAVLVVALFGSGLSVPAHAQSAVPTATSHSDPWPRVVQIS